MTRARSIVLVIRRLAGRGGGAERIYCELANLLVERGYSVTCLYCEWSRDPPAFRIDPRVKLMNLWQRSVFNPGLPAYARALSVGYVDGRLWAPVAWASKHGAFAWLLRRYLLENEPAIAIALMPNAITPTLLAAMGTKTRVVASNHNAPEQDYGSNEKWDQNPLDRAIRMPLLEKAARVHVLLEDYVEYFPSAVQQKIRVIHNYPSEEVGFSGEEVERRKVVLGVGRLTSVKNYQLLVEAWARLAEEFSDWEVQIFGQGAEEANLRRRIEQLGIGERVRLMGQTSRIRDAYDSAKILAHPSRYEGFPLSVIEALARGLPVVGLSETTGVKQLVSSGRNGELVAAEQGADGFASALRRIMTAEDKWLSMSRAAQESARPYSKDKYAEKWIELIEELIRQA